MSSIAPKRLRRVGPHHFAFLRALAEGVSERECASRYLAIERAGEQREARYQIVDTVRGIARRSGERLWRLVGVAIKVTKKENEPPTLQEFVEKRNLDDFSVAEQLAHYLEAYPKDQRLERRSKLRQSQVDMLHRLKLAECVDPAPTDLVSEWYADEIAKKLIGAGHNTLQDLALAIAAGGKWYRTMPGVGELKAKRIASFLSTLIPAATRVERRLFELKDIGGQHPDALLSRGLPATKSTSVTTPSQCLLDATSDSEAVKSWIGARCSSKETAKSYEREARRLLLWLRHERGGRSLAAMTVEDCLGYQAFLQHIPPAWVSSNRVEPGMPGWAPFKGQLSQKSQHQAIKIVSGLFAWLVAVRYIHGNPWVAVNTDTGETDPAAKLLDTKSIGDAALAQIYAYIDSRPPSPPVSRIRFVIRFVESVGLRSNELISASLGDFALAPEGWTLRVRGKGGKTRIAIVPQSAFRALQEYLRDRGWSGIETAPPEEPLLARADGTPGSVSYQALYKTVKTWIRKAVFASSLSTRERGELSGATTHWLRHTFGTKAVGEGVPYDVVQQQLGHSTIATTMNIYARAPLERRAKQLGRVFD